MFYWSWAGGPVLIVRTACYSRNVLCFTGLRPEDRCSSWGLPVIPETCYVLLVLGRRTGAHREDCLLFQKRVMFYWSWAGGPVLIVRTACYSRNVLCFTGLGPEDRCSSWGLLVIPETCYVLLVLGRRTGAHREDCLLFQKRVMLYWSWAGGPVLIVRTACYSRNVLCFTGLGPEDRCSSWGLLVIPETCYVLLVLGRRTGAHREDCLLFQKRVMFYWSWAGGPVLIVRTACYSRNVLCFTGFGREDRCSSWGLLVIPETCYVLLVLLIVRTCYWNVFVLLVLGRRTGAHREDCLLFQKRVMGTKLYIYVCITGFQNKYVRYIKNVITEIQPRLWCIKDIPHTTPPVYLPADSINKACIKVRVSWAGLINCRQELSPNSPNI